MLPPGASEAALLAELIAASLDPQLAGIAVSIAQLKRMGPAVFLYGVTLPRADAAILREKVAALEAQEKKGLVTDLETHKALLALGIPAPDAQALLSLWAAKKSNPRSMLNFCPAETTVLLPPGLLKAGGSLCVYKSRYRLFDGCVRHQAAS